MDSNQMLQLVLDGGINALKNADLAKFLKSKKCRGVGDKSTRIWRIKCYLDGEQLLVDGENPALFKPKQLKMACAKRGLSCMGNQDEMLELLIEYLRKMHPDKVVTFSKKMHPDKVVTSSKKVEQPILTMDSNQMLQLVLDGRINALKNTDLAKFLKAKKCQGVGDKSTRIWRIKCYLDGEQLLVDGENPAVLKTKQLKMACAKRGLSCLGNQDEMLELLIEYLRKMHPDKVVTSGKKVKGASDGSDSQSKGMEVANRILELNEAFDFAGILSVLGANVTPTSPTNVMRKAYLKVSLLIHPDKLKGEVATKAFQAAVYAFERLSKPELFMEEPETKGKKKAKKISRSNEGCFRTKVYCPRCKVEWGQAVDGCPKYAYNFFMQALRTYHCSTCLLEFGCMTAIHRCPHCRGAFEYAPNDFHRAISCENPKCKKPFGFYMYHVSSAIENQFRKEVKATQLKRMKKEEATRSRLERTKRKYKHEEEVNVGLSERRLKRKKRKEQEKMFKRGLLDACPRCGFRPQDDGEERDHLRNCTDKEAWLAHKEEKAKAEVKLASKKKKYNTQVEMQNLAAWEFLGGDTANLWLLTHEQLKGQCLNHGLDEKGTKDELIARVAAHRAVMDSRMLTDGTGGKSKANTRIKFDRSSLPTNLHKMSMSQIKSVCASHGYIPKGETKDDIIEEIEGSMAKDQGLLLLK